MPSTALTDFGLNERQLEFVKLVSRGTPSDIAASEAGYTRETLYHLLRTPSVVAAIEWELRRLLLTEAAPLAYKVALDMLRSEGTGAPTRALLVKTILDRAGIVPPAADKDPASGKQLNEMSTDELVGVVAQRTAEAARLEAELDRRANAAKRVDSAPIQGDTALDVAGLLD